MKILSKTWIAKLFISFVSISTVASAQSAGTHVDVGPGHAGAGASASGAWQHTETESRVGAANMGRALAIGAGPNGLSLSHSIGVNAGGRGVGHNFNLSIGPGGSHVSHGGVVTEGGNSRVLAGGNARGGLFPSGGSSVSGFGRRTDAYSRSRTIPAPPMFPFSRPGRWMP